MLDRATEICTCSWCSVLRLKHCATFRIVAAVFKVLVGAGLGMPCTMVSTEAHSSPPVCRTMMTNCRALVKINSGVH